MEVFPTSTAPVAIAESGEKQAKRLPLNIIRRIAAGVFVATGIYTMLGAPPIPA